MDAEKIRKELRDGRSDELTRNRRIVALAAAGLVDFTIISLYQSGVLRRLPDLPGKIFDSNQVNAARKAYALGLPDGTTGAALFAVNMMLATAGGSRRSGRPAWMDLLLGASAVSGAGAAFQYLYDMVFKQSKACPYCIVGGLAHFGMVALMAPQGWRLLRKIFLVSHRP